MPGRYFRLLTLIAAVMLTPLSVNASPAPDFALADARGKQVQLQDFKGQPLILHFWATWCPYCKKLQPGLQALADEYQAQGLVLLGISFREDEGVQPQAVLNERGHSFSTLVAGEEVASLYGVRGTPTTVFIDRRGQIVGVTNTSAPDDPKLRELLLQSLR